MRYTYETARTQRRSAEALIDEVFGDRATGGAPEGNGAPCLDAEFLSADRRAAMGFYGLPYAAPVCRELMNDPGRRRRRCARP